MLLILQNVLLTPEQLRAFGWRIPFVIGAGLALFALWMRRDLEETEAFKTAKAKGQEGGLGALWAHRREVLIVIGLTMGGTLAFYVYTIYMQKFLKLTVGLTDAQSTWVSAASLIFALCLQPLYGALSDRIGRRPVLLAFGIMGTLGTVPLMTALSHAKGPWEAFMFVALGWLMTAPYTSINAIVKAELFPGRLARDRRRAALCAGGVVLRRHGGIYRAMVQAAGHGKRLLLLRERRDFLLAPGLLLPARHQGDVRARPGGDGGAGIGLLTKVAHSRAGATAQWASCFCPRAVAIVLSFQIARRVFGNVDHFPLHRGLAKRSMRESRIDNLVNGLI